MSSTPAKPPQRETFKNVRTCQHIKVTGVPCGGPPMRGEQFCYFHQRMLRGVKTPPNVRIHPVALIEDEESIQASLMEIINALARNHIDLRRADLMLKALWIAVKNSRRAKFNVSNSQMVREIPDYPAPPKPVAVPKPAPAFELDENEQYIKKCKVKNALAQLQSRALGTIPAPSVVSSDVSAAPPAPVLVPAAGSTTKIQANPQLTTKAVAQIDPTQHKPPARAGAPMTTRIAVNQQKTRT